MVSRASAYRFGDTQRPRGENTPRFGCLAGVASSKAWALGGFRS